MQTAIATASWRGDLDRCRLLCDSIDRYVSGHTRHLILVEDRDAALFAPLAGPRRAVVPESALLPRWLRVFPDPTTFGRRRVWLSPFGPPLRGWHVQQLRRVALAATMPEAVMLSLDSDTVFVKPFDVSALREDGAVRFYRVSPEHHRVDPRFADEHGRWWRAAGRLLGVASPDAPTPGYIATGIAWRTDTVRAMTERIARAGRLPWMARLAATRALSECTIYGRFVDEAEGRPDRHLATERAVCRVYWSGAALDAAALDAFVSGLSPDEAAIGIQSFTGTDPVLVRRAAGLD